MNKIEFEALISGVSSNLPRSNPPNSLWVTITNFPIHDGGSLLLENGREPFGLESRVGDKIKITIERMPR